MGGMDEEDRPRRVVGHTIGETLDDLSVRDLEDRIALLRAEIDRLEAAKRGKAAARDAAGSLFGTRVTRTGQVSSRDRGRVP